MKISANSLNALVCIATVAGALGCGVRSNAKKPANGSITANANAVNANEDSLTNKAIDAALGEQKLGIAECDELFDALAQQTSSDNDSIVTSTAKKVFLNKLRDDIRKSLRENKNDKTAAAAQCKDFKTRLDEYQGNSNSG